MSKTRIRTLSLVGLIGTLIGSALVLIGGLISGTTTTDATGTHLTSIGNPLLFAIGLFLSIAFGIVAFIAWIFALIRTAQLQRWGWFVTMLVIGGIVTVIWAFAGPDTPGAPTTT